jgi:hypothetical protein
MTAPGRTVAEYRGVAEFFNFLGSPRSPRSGTSRPATCRSSSASTRSSRPRATTTRTRASTPLPAADPQPTENSRASSSATCPRSATSSRKRSRRPSRASRRPAGARQRRRARQRRPARLRAGQPLARDRVGGAGPPAPPPRPPHLGDVSPTKGPMRRRTIFRHKLLPYLLLAPQLAITSSSSSTRPARPSINRCCSRTRSACAPQFVWFENFQTCSPARSTSSRCASRSSSHVGDARRDGAGAPARGHGGPGHPRRDRLPHAARVAVRHRARRGRRAVAVHLPPEHRQIGQGLRALGIPWDYRIDGDQALGLVIFVSAWKQVSYNFLFFLAGLQSIPKTIVEAAAIDGASRPRFWRWCSRCSRRPPSSCSWSTSSTPSSTPSASSTRSPRAARAAPPRRSCTGSTATATSTSTSAARRRSR